MALQDNRHPADADPLRGFPRVRLGFFPTPLQGLPNLGRLLGHDRLYIKRDDLTGLSLGGNKTRSLEFLLGDAIARGADVVIAAGGLQSNLCSLTAAACAKVGLGCVLAHNDLPPQALQGNMLLSRMFGAKPVFLGRRTEEERAQAVQEIAADLRKEGRRPYVIENGASTPLGALGYTSAAYELHKQCRRLGIALKHVVIAGAMGGTASGFVFGTALLEHPFHVHVISVEYPAIELRKRMLGLIEGMERLTGLTPGRPACPAASPLTHMVAPEDVMTVCDDYLGGGYAVPTPESLRMVHDLPRLEGIFIENVYAAKTLAGLAGLIWRGIIPCSEPACFIHTGGMAALFAQFSN